MLKSVQSALNVSSLLSLCTGWTSAIALAGEAYKCIKTNTPSAIRFEP
jgi:hypothetical protein